MKKSPKVSQCLKYLGVLNSKNTMELFKTKNAHLSSMWFQHDKKPERFLTLISRGLMIWGFFMLNDLW